MVLEENRGDYRKVVPKVVRELSRKIDAFSSLQHCKIAFFCDFLF